MLTKSPRFYSGWSIALSFLCAFMLTIFPWPLGLRWLQPTWVLLVLVYWLLSAPYRFGVITAFLVGVFVDVLTGVPLGIHALIYTLLAFILLRYNTAIRCFGLGRLLILVAGIQTADLTIQYFISAHYHQEAHTALYWLPLLTTPACWPLLTQLLNSRRDQL